MKKKIYIITIIIFILDQASKMLVEKYLLNPVNIIGEFFLLEKVHNTGGAWGILNNSTWLLAMISAVALIILNEYISKEKEFTKLSVISYGLLLAGILGNFIDRIVYNYVIDFFSFNFGSYSFPVFNIADMAIVIGIILLILDFIGGELNERRNRQRKY